MRTAAPGFCVPLASARHPALWLLHSHVDRSLGGSSSPSCLLQDLSMEVNVNTPKPPLMAAATVIAGLDTGDALGYD